MQAISPDSYSDSGSDSVRTSSLILVVRAGLATIGVGLIVLSFAAFGDAISANRSTVFVPIALGLAFILSGLAVWSRWQKAAFWFSVAMLGQVLCFQLINAGYQLRYQHYKPLSELLFLPNLVYVGLLIAQLILVIFAMKRFVPTLLIWTRTNVRAWQLILLALCFFIPTTTVSPDPTLYIAEFIFAGLIQLLALATFLLFGMSIPPDSLEKLRTLVNRFSENGKSTSTSTYFLVFITAIFVALLAVVLNIFSYEQHPHVPDEIAYLMQAKFFAAGGLTMPAPPVPEAFDVYLMKIDGSVWYPVTPPGWAMLLAVGAFVGAPFLVNPILAAFNLLLCYWLIARLYSRSTANVSLVLLAVSPWFVFLAMSFMTHMAALMCLLLAAVGVVKARETENWSWGFLSGLAIGFVSTIRPLEAVAVAGLSGLWMLGVGGKRVSFKAMAAAAFTTILVGGLGLAFNAKLAGNLLQFPINAYTDEVFGPGSNAYGFGPDRGMGWQLDPYPGHGPIDALINTNLNVSALNTELFGWWLGSFLFIGALLCFGKLRNGDFLMLAVVAAIYCLHFFYYFSGGPDFGARYWFLMIVPLVVLTVRGIRSLAEKLTELGRDADVRLYATIAALIVITLTIFIPWRAVDKYRDFRGMRADVRKLEGRFPFDRGLVLIQGNKHPEYDSAFIYNSPDLSGDGPIYAWDRDADTRQKLLDAYPDRPVWIVSGPSLTGRGFEVSAGPLSGASLRAGQDH